MRVLCVGQLGWDVTNINGNKKKSYGGSVLHFSLAAALMGLKVDLLSYVNKREWKDMLISLEKLGIGTHAIVDFEHTIKFNMSYNKNLEFCEDEFSMIIDSKEPQIHKELTLLDNYDIYNMCETLPEQDLKTYEQIKYNNCNAEISIQLHLDNLMRDKNLYLSLLNKIDYIFMNMQEAFYLSNASSIEKAINFLKSKTKKAIFITSHDKNYVITKQKVLSIDTIKTNKVIDPTGAGDCFAGGAIAGIAAGKEIELALKWGTIVSHLKLHGYSSEYIFKILMVSEC